MRALGVVPLDDTPAIRTAPPFRLFVKPGINAYFLLAVDVGQHLTVVRSAVIVEIDNSLAGKIRTLGTVGDPFLEGTGSASTSTAHNG